MVQHIHSGRVQDPRADLQIEAKKHVVCVQTLPDPEQDALVVPFGKSEFLQSLLNILNNGNRHAELPADLLDIHGKLR